MRFRVPQFIEIKDSIVGPLGIKQLLYLLAGGVVLAFCWFYLELWAFVVVAVLIMPISAAFAFYKFNGKPFIYLISALLKYLSQPHLYLWKRNKNKNNSSL